jgi:prepilin-type N-terminal cleavage/methylation domain-containing protein
MIARTKHPRGFTLTEILIVIGIIVLLLAIAVPTMRVLTGGRSIDGAENQISAFVGRARGEAIGLQEERGVMFYYDPDTEKTMLAQVRVTDYPPGGTAEVYLDLVPDRDFFSLPSGIDGQVVDDCAVTAPPASLRGDDAFIGYNTVFTTAGTTCYRGYGGVILFDAYGQIINRTYGFRGLTSTGTATDIFNLLFAGAPPAVAFLNPATTGPILHTQFGLVLYDREEFANQGFSSRDSQIDVAAGVYTDNATPSARSPEAREEHWINDNSVPILINRYNGTFVRGE